MTSARNFKQPANQTTNQTTLKESHNIMIRQLIIPGIIAGALHGGLLLIPNPPPPPPPTTTEVALSDTFPAPPPIPPIPDNLDDLKKGDEEKSSLPPLPVAEMNFTPPSVDPGFHETWIPDKPRVSFDKDAMTAGLGDYTKRGITNSEGGATKCRIKDTACAALTPCSMARN